MKAFVCCMMLAFVNLYFAFQYLCYYADFIGENVGEIVADFLVPILFGLFTGFIGVTIMCSGFRIKYYKKHWWTLALSAFLALLPTLYYIIVGTLIGDRGG